MAKLKDILPGDEEAQTTAPSEEPVESGIPEMSPEEERSLQEALGQLPGDVEFQASVEVKLRELDARLQRVELEVLPGAKAEEEVEVPPDITFYPAAWVQEHGVRTAFIRAAPSQGYITYDNRRIPLKKGWVMNLPGNVYTHLVNSGLV